MFSLIFFFASSSDNVSRLAIQRGVGSSTLLSAIEMQENTIFMGIPKSALRGAICELVKRKTYATYVIPCSGRFAVADTFISCGVPPEKIVTSDITLFSSLVGYYICGHDLGALDVTINDVPMLETIEGIAEVLYTIKLAKIPQNTYYNEQIYNDMILRKHDHIEKIISGLQHLKTKCAGISYSIQDLRDSIKEHDDNDTLIFVHPPIESKNDYVKMVAAADINWINPPIKQFDPQTEFVTLCANLLHNNADTVMYLHENDKPDLPLAQWHCFFAAQDSKFKLEYLYANKQNTMHTAANRAQFKAFRAPPYPILSDTDEITPNSIVQVVPVDKMVAMYYRDLFVHRLGSTNAERHFLFLIDNKVFSVRGLMYHVQNRGVGDRFREVFGVVRSNKHYRHIGRLAMRLITSKEFRDMILRPGEVFEKRYITSTMISMHPVAREAKGILEIYDSTQSADGMYHLQYEAEFKDRSFQEFLLDWLNEEESYGKNQRPKRKRVRSSSRPR